MKAAQSYPTLCDPTDCSPPGSSVHRILQARILEWVAILFPGDLPNPGIKPRSPLVQGDSLPSESSAKPGQRICLQCRKPGFDPWLRKVPWRREWLHIPVFLLGEFHGQRSLAECIPWGQRESDPTEGLTHTHTHTHIYKTRVILATEDFCEN